ncbi:uncharacterized protein UHOD_06221 [Ustilago sp. UG-2017b]|nr:uncharacterized protein UHOD_06221 [Ustilago sp. UG-2017b]
MKFSSGFTAFVAASVATANLGTAAPVNNNGLATRDVSQSNSQSTSQQASGKNVHQDSDSAQHNNQGVKISKDASFQISHPAIVVPASNHPSSGSTTPSSGGLTTPATSEGEHHDSEDGKTGDLISLSLLNGNKANAQVAGTGNQSNKRSTGSLVDADALNDNNTNLQILGTGNQKNVDSHKEHHDGHRDAENGDLISAILLNGNDVNAQVAGTGNQENKRGLFGAASGKQDASADGFGGSSFQGQSNAPVLSGAGNSLTAGGAQGSQNNGQGGSITQDLLQKLQARQLFSQGKQGASANGQGGTSFQGQSNAPILSGSGNSLTAGGAQGAENNGFGGSIEQTLSQLQQLGGGLGKRQLFAQGKQGASADGFGGSSAQGQTSNPVLSGSGSSLTSGGAQLGENNGQGGEIQQSLLQKLGLGKRQLFASGTQEGSTDGYGGFSSQGQDNRPVVSGAGNSVTAGGSQFGQNDGTGGSVDQSIFQKLGLGERQFKAFGSQDASADGFGGSSFQYQNNRPVVLGTGNSVTAGGAQGATNNGQGGDITQQLQQLLGRRQFQGLGQGINQGIDQTGSANAHGGTAYIYGNNGPASVDGTATAGTVNQGASGQQDGAQSATQGLTQETLNRFFARQLQGLEQGIGQGIHQNGQADAQGGSAYLVGGNGPVYVKNGATAGTVNQNGQADQQGQQSGTQSLQQSFQNLFGRAIQDQDQGVSQGTTQTGSADAVGGDVKVVGGWSAGPVTVDASSHAGVVDQDSTSNQKSNQNAVQTANKENINQLWARQIQTQAQGNTQNVNTNADVSATASPKAASSYFFTHHPVAFDNTAVGGSINQDVQANQANKQGASENANNYKNIQARAIPSALNYGAQSASTYAQGGSSYSYETNDKVVNGNGLTTVQGGPQTSNGSAAAGTIKQLLQL